MVSGRCRMVFGRSCMVSGRCWMVSGRSWMDGISATNEQSMITNDFTICKVKVKFNIISETQDNNYNIENNVFS